MKVTRGILGLHISGHHVVRASPHTPSFRRICWLADGRPQSLVSFLCAQHLAAPCWRGSRPASDNSGDTLSSPGQVPMLCRDAGSFVLTSSCPHP